MRKSAEFLIAAAIIAAYERGWEGASDLCAFFGAELIIFPEAEGHARLVIIC